MFAPNIVGTANATSAGWGNLVEGANRWGIAVDCGGGISFGIQKEIAWRYFHA